ncbi:hydroxylysine kinase-like, partial [Saccostrea cucullata]|uniref:hydroxylysine kinase-like n=1 Tax=Saccostrea cuccullata TaxID=36930 RepID=UPI002ED58B96
STPYHFYLVRLLTYVPGVTFFEKPTLPRSLYNIGKSLGKLHHSLEGFHHRFFDNYKFMWNLTEVERLRDFLVGIQDEKRKALMIEIIDAFTKEVVPKYDKLTKGMIHGDLNESNIIVQDCAGQDSVPQESRVCDVAAIIDFNDVALSYLVFDVAICIAYMSIKCHEMDQKDVGGHVLAGYLSERSLNSTERDVMKACVCARIAQSLVMGAYSYYMDPNNTYVLNTATRGWPLISMLWEIPKSDIDARWNKIIEEYE